MIRVTTEQLYAKGNEMNQAVGSIKIQFEEVKNLINGSNSYWIGDGGDRLRKLYQELDNDITEILKILGTYPTKLEKINGVYIERNAKALNEANSLPGDVL